MPAVSVVIPAYNAARTVVAAVDSVLAQTFGDFELIVVDDGSRDQTAEVVTALTDPRIKLVRTENGGVSAARNRGLEVATGAYVAFLDADDAWRPTKLERQHATMAGRPDIGLCFGAAQLVDDQLRSFGAEAAAIRDDYTEALVLEGNVITGSASGVMARTPLIIDAGGFDTRLSQCADWDLWLRLSVRTAFLPLRDSLVLYRAITGTMSSDPALLERDTLALLDKFFGTPESAPYQHLRNRAYANQRLIFAGSYLHAHEVGAAVRCAAGAVRDDPRIAIQLGRVPFRWVDRARRRALGKPPSARDAISRRV